MWFTNKGARGTGLLVPLAWMSLATIGMIGPAGGEAHAQGIIYTWDGAAPYDVFGSSISGAVDIDRDGFADVIVGAWGNDGAGAEAGRAYIYRGQTGVLLYSHAGDAPGDQFGTSVAGLPDIDGDGYDDYIIGAWKSDAAGTDSGRAYVYDGQTGTRIYTLTGEAAGDGFGYAVAAAGDVDGDGHGDFIVGAFGNDAGGAMVDAGRAYVYSGFTGALLYTFTGVAAGDAFGYSVDGAGDFDNDNYDDVVVSAIYNDDYDVDSGRAYVYSGFDGHLLAGFSGQTSGDAFGWSVAGAGDVNLDGLDDVIVGAIYNGAGGTRAGRAYVFAGSSGNLLYILTGEAANDQFGVSVAGVGDYDQDGHADVAVGAWQHDGNGTDAGRAYVFSGRNGVKLFTTDGEAPLDRFGGAVASAGDVDLDGSDDLVVGAVFHDTGGSESGRAYVFSGTIAPVVNSIVPGRTYFSDPVPATISGDHFALGGTPTVTIGQQAATNVVVVDDNTITCDVPAWTDRGPVDVAVSNTFGDGVLSEGFAYTPAALLSGDAVPGGTVQIRFLIHSGDDIYAIWGLPPEVSLPVGSFIGDLCIFPFVVLFYIPSWPFDELASTGDIPDDPGLSGVEFLIQGLVGRLSERQGAWTNCLHLLIQ